MGFGIYSLIEAGVLLINALAILNEERFLSKIGWSANTNQDQFSYGEAPGVKTRLIELISSVRTLMRIPLIFVNSLVIVLELLFG
ncbi:hypothetical protein ACHWQZ_G009688 [Mnemiopsis leidyi]